MFVDDLNIYLTKEENTLNKVMYLINLHFFALHSKYKTSVEN